MPNAEMRPKFYVKSFFAESVQDAMEQAKREMGADALLLNTREAPIEARHMGRYEVVFGEYTESMPEPPRPAAPVVDEAPPEEQRRCRVCPVAKKLQKNMSELRAMLTNKGEDLDAGPRSPERYAERLVLDLQNSGMDEDLAAQVAASVTLRMRRHTVHDITRMAGPIEWDEATVNAELSQELAARCPIKPEVGPITVLVGPPGSGKTTTLVKLAISQGLALGKSVRLVSADTYRVGGASQLETYASILGVPFHAVETPAALAQLLDYAPSNVLHFIDTPGYSASLFNELGSDLAGMLSRRQDVDTHLVLTASMRPSAIRDAAGLYGAFGPSKLLFTHLDEATPFATMFCEASRRQLALSFFATGQSVPEDLEVATMRRVTDSLVKELPKVMRAVA